jgi:hypothetical protein
MISIHPFDPLPQQAEVLRALAHFAKLRDRKLTAAPRFSRMRIGVV